MVTSKMDLPFCAKTLHSFDGTTSARTSVFRPDRYRDLTRLMTSLPKMSFRGAGLSYALGSAYDSTVPTIDMTLFDRFLDFDPIRGWLKVEAGVRLGEALQWSVLRGWNIGVLPGHPTITVGGCVAFNVHGKSQFSTGNFENIVEALTLFHPRHGELVCSRTENPEAFWLTLGGFGLTGLILDVTLRLTPLKGSQIERRAISCDSLVHAFEQMIELEHEFDYIYSWNNGCRTGRNFGRGVVYAERFIGDPKNPIYGSVTSKLTEVDARPRLALFRGETAALINRIYEVKERHSKPLTLHNIGPATFPIAGKEFYFSLLGKPGFIEYQCIFPSNSVTNALRKLDGLIQRFGIHPSLTSTKFFRGTRRDLCFQMDGYCLAIDVPVAGHKNILPFISSMDELVIECGGIANIAKDSRLSRATVSAMYPGFEAFWNAVHAWDPSHHFSNSVRSRLEPV